MDLPRVVPPLYYGSDEQVRCFDTCRRRKEARAQYDLGTHT